MPASTRSEATGSTCYDACHMKTDFSQLALSQALLTVASELGFATATPIQAQAIPVLLEGKDLVGQSKTGSGKTAAFGLPMIDKVDLRTREPGALVLCPTRELAAQVARELRKFGRRHPGLSVVVLSGGEPVRFQATALSRGSHIVVGTPGRVLDHVRRENLRLGGMATVVLDEADRMLEMGFQKEVEAILKDLPTKRQTLLFSATFPGSIEALSAKYQNKPVRIRVEDDPEQTSDTCQWLVRAKVDGKPAALMNILEQHPHESALIFVNFKSVAATVESELSKHGLSVASLHGDIEQFDRDRVMAKFRNGSTRVLVATDVAARGLDVAKLDLVVNYELPSQPEVYLHRIGRTGRAGKPGLAISLCGERDGGRIKEIERYMGMPISLAPSPSSTPPSPSSRRAPTAEPAATRDAKMQTLRIAGGRKDKLRPGDILGALTGEAGGLSAEHVGTIEIHDRFSYVAVSKAESAKALRSLCDGRIKGKRFKTTLVQ
jgi:ATP-independent RNA helicase DbpA